MPINKHFHSLPKGIYKRSPLLLAIIIGLSPLSLNAEDVYGPIKQNDTLGRIVIEKYGRKTSIPRQQIFDQIFKDNPQAFINNNINLLRIGQSLKLPDPADIVIPEPPAPPPKTDTEKLKHLQQDLSNKSKELDDLKSSFKQEKEKHSKQIATLEAEIEKLKTQQPSGTSQETGGTASDNTQIADFKAQITKLTADHNRATADYKKQIATLEEQVKTLESSKTEGSAKLTEEIATLKKDHQEQLATLEKKVAKLTEANKKQADTQADTTKLEERIKSLTAQHQQQVVSLEKKITELTESNKKQENAQADTEKLEQEIAALKATHAEKVAELEKTIAQLKQDQSTSKPEADEETALELSTLQSTLSAQQNENKSLQKQLSSTQEKLDAAQATIKDLEKQSVQAKSPEKQAPVAIQKDDKTESSSFLSWLLPLLGVLLGLFLGVFFKNRSTAKANQALRSSMIKQEDSSDRPTPKTTKPVATQSTSETPATAPKTKQAETTTEPDQPHIPDSKEATIKLAMAQAYVELGDSASAAEVLSEVVEEGSPSQQDLAKSLLEML